MTITGGGLRVAGFAELDTATLYDLLRLRVDVFVVEQGCAYAELDGLDTAADTRHIWQTDGTRPIAYLRLVSLDSGTPRIGRVCVAREVRGAGHASRLMTAALGEVGDRACELHAQSHLARFYGTFGFVPTGDEHLDDGIPHIPMRRPASPG